MSNPATCVKLAVQEFAQRDLRSFPEGQLWSRSGFGSACGVAEFQDTLPGACAIVVTKAGWRSLLFACLSKIDLSGYLHRDRCFIIGCSDFLESFDDTSTLESSQRLDHSRVESARILAIRFGVPKPSANPDF